MACCSEEGCGHDSGIANVEPPQFDPSGSMVVLAKITAKPGRGDEIAQLLKVARKRAESEEEPGTLTYRATRSEANSDSFVIFEEYKLPNGLVEHGQGEPLKALATSGAIQNIEIEYYKEFA